MWSLAGPKRTQTLVQLNDELLRRLDERAAREDRSRSALIRAAIEAYLHDEEKARIDREIIEGYERIPPTEEEMAWAAASTRKMIEEEPWWGQGVGFQPEADPQYAGLSAHNLYLQIALQLGYVGVGLFVGFFGAIWASLWRNRRSRMVRLVGAFFIGIIVHESFEVTLTQNNLAIGCIFWLILSFGLNPSLIGPLPSFARRARPPQKAGLPG